MAKDKEERGEYASEEVEITYRRRANIRLGSLHNVREMWMPHWRAIGEVFLPRRVRWLATPDQRRGSQINGTIVDETGVIASRILASGMMSGLTSPTRPWFRLGLRDLAEIPFGPLKQWLADCERRMMRVLAESNFYDSMAQLYQDGGTFGSAAMIIYEDDDDVIRVYQPCIGEFYFGLGPRNDVVTLGRKFVMTVQQVVGMFGLDAVSETVRLAFTTGQLDREVVICHLIEPNDRVYSDDGETVLGYLVPPSFPYRECYWEEAAAKDDYCLRASPFREKPFVGARWDVTSNDPYGRSPGMDALPAVQQLQIQQRRKAEAIDKLVRPPMVGSVSMKNEPKSILPGGVSYVTDVQGAGFKPAFTVDPRLQEMLADIAQTQQRVGAIMFNDLFMMISQLDTVRTATEIDARKEEKLIQLGPVVERWMNEVLDPVIDRVFSIMQRRNLFLEAPEEIHGMEIDVQYISMLAESQRVSSTLATERVLALTGNLMAVYPEALDNFDADFLLRNFADQLYLNPKGVRSDKEIAAIRQAKAQAAAQAQAQEQIPAAADAAKTLSETQVGGGQSALQMMMQ